MMTRRMTCCGSQGCDEGKQKIRLRQCLHRLLVMFHLWVLLPPLGAAPVYRAMFTIIIIVFIAICFLIMVFHICHKLCQDPVPPPAYRIPQGPTPLPAYTEPQGPVSPHLAPMPALPSLPSGAIPVGLEPPPYSEVTAKPFLYPLPQGPCPECGHNPRPQPSAASQI